MFDETVSHLAFSADGSYFASCESDDHLVRVWFEDICCEYIIIVLFTFVFGYTKLRKMSQISARSERYIFFSKIYESY